MKDLCRHPLSEVPFYSRLLRSFGPIFSLSLSSCVNLGTFEFKLSYKKKSNEHILCSIPSYTHQRLEMLYKSGILGTEKHPLCILKEGTSCIWLEFVKYNTLPIMRFFCMHFQIKLDCSQFSKLKEYILAQQHSMCLESVRSWVWFQVQ